MKAAPAGHVVLDRMTPAEFEAYLQPAIAEYAADKIAAGNWSEAEALSHAQISLICCRRVLSRPTNTCSRFGMRPARGPWV